VLGRRTPPSAQLLARLRTFVATAPAPPPAGPVRQPAEGGKSDHARAQPQKAAQGVAPLGAANPPWEWRQLRPAPADGRARGSKGLGDAAAGQAPAPPQKKPAPSRETAKGGDLDDEIPFASTTMVYGVRWTNYIYFFCSATRPVAVPKSPVSPVAIFICNSILSRFSFRKAGPSSRIWVLKASLVSLCRRRLPKLPIS
jgi:hypothetical protein